jgi:hypothetical protein
MYHKRLTYFYKIDRICLVQVGKEATQMHCFRVYLSRVLDKPRLNFPSRIFFPDEDKDNNEAMLVEKRESRLLMITLSRNAVKKLKKGYMQSDGATAVEHFIKHQLSPEGSSVQNWPGFFGWDCICDRVEQIK